MKTDVCLNDDSEDCLFIFPINGSQQLSEHEKKEAKDTGVKETRNIDTEPMTGTEQTKQSSTETFEFSNPVLNQNNKRFSKKYDKGRDYLISEYFFTDTLFLFREFLKVYSY